MPDVGTVTGIVGMLTGIAGSVMGFLGYRQSIKSKTLDLRLQLRKDVNALKALVDPLPATIAAAVQSRQRVLSAQGLALSGNQVAFEQAAAADAAAVAQLVPQVKAFDRDYFVLTGTELELFLSDVHRVSILASGIAATYKATMEADSSARRQIRAEHTAMVAAHIQAPKPRR
jgi:hypothetical protein